MNKDQVKGATKDIVGKLQEAAAYSTVTWALTPPALGHPVHEHLGTNSTVI
jgi:hypothetical protein